MAGAGGLDAIQTMLTPSIDYALWHVEDRFLKADNSPIRGTFRATMPMAQDLDVAVPHHPAFTGSDDGMYGMTTRNLSAKQRQRPPGLLYQTRPENAGTQVYTIDPTERSSNMPFLQKGKWTNTKNTTDPPALQRNWTWTHERDVRTSLSDTAYTYSKLEKGWKKPTWSMHFGLNASRPTFGKIKCPASAHQAPATLAHEMTMDKELFSPFRTTMQPSLSLLPSRSVTPAGGELVHSKQRSRGSRAGSRASRAPTGNAEVQSMEDIRPETSATSEYFDFQQQSDLMSVLSGGGGDFGRVASPALGGSSPQSNSKKVVIARSCKELDGIGRSLVILPAKWAPIQHLIKDELTARSSLSSKTQRQVLSEAPKHIMRHLHAQMRSHPDSPWQPTCFPVVQ